MISVSQQHTRSIFQLVTLVLVRCTLCLVHTVGLHAGIAQYNVKGHIANGLLSDDMQLQILFPCLVWPHAGSF